MRFARFVQRLELLLVLGLAGSMVGCGSGAEQGSPAGKEGAGKAIAKDTGKAHKEAAAAKKEVVAAARKAAAMPPKAAP